MNNDPIERQIEDLGNRRLAGCACWWAGVVLIGGFVLGLVAKHVRDKPTCAAVAFAVSGLLLGYVTSILASGSRKIVLMAFVVLPLVLSLGLFSFRTVLGYTHALPLRLTIAPLFLAAGFLAGYFARNFRRWW